MRTFLFETKVWLPRARTEVFPFFADAQNLARITPAWLNFVVLTPTPIAMRVGTLIDYRLRIRGFPVRWQTEISAWTPPHRFVDRQLRGPYRLLEHTHTFSESRGGTLCHDAVRYHPPGGALVNWLWVQRDVRRIFEFRRQRLQELFPPAVSETK